MIEEIEQRQQRKQNLIISGIPEPSIGPISQRIASDTAACVTLAETLGIHGLSIKSVARLGSLSSGKNRLLRVCLNDIETRQAILRNATKLKQNEKYSGIYINPDLTPAQQEANYKLRKERREQRAKGIDAVIYRGEVVDRKSIPVFQQ